MKSYKERDVWQHTQCYERRVVLRINDDRVVVHHSENKVKVKQSIKVPKIGEFNTWIENAVYVGQIGEEEFKKYITLAYEPANEQEKVRINTTPEHRMNELVAHPGLYVLENHICVELGASLGLDGKELFEVLVGKKDITIPMVAMLESMFSVDGKMLLKMQRRWNANR